MIGEANAYYNAIKIESIILNAIDNNCNVEDFVKKELFDCSTFSNLQVCQQAGGNDPQQQLVEGHRRVFQWAPGALH